jgi:UDP-N-acetyl-D-glucosamine/UDP-N-acetyl-D-galactosamine dehydrogenase
MKSVCVIGLGYVGLPLAVGLSREYDVTGVDMSDRRIRELIKCHDSTGEVSDEELRLATMKLRLEVVDGSDVYIVCVPTPVDDGNVPDLTSLVNVTSVISLAMKKGSLVIYESTVYPGCTDDVCIPILEASGKRLNKEFFVSYSPERINPGDKLHTLYNTTKIVSGSCGYAMREAGEIYKSIGIPVFFVDSIRIAEAAKAVENAQRDINIAFMNELALMFSRMGIDTLDVLEAAGTKWNFVPFVPGLVGGHCIGVDPYYLAYAARQYGYSPRVLLSGREVNESIGVHIAHTVLKKGCRRVAILGITFKEDCPDIRNSKVVDIYNELQAFACDVVVYDPIADPKDVKTYLGIELVTHLPWIHLDGVIVAVAHKQFKDFIPGNYEGVIYDVKGIISRNINVIRL